MFYVWHFEDWFWRLSRFWKIFFCIKVCFLMILNWRFDLERGTDGKMTDCLHYSGRWTICTISIPPIIFNLLFCTKYSKFISINLLTFISPQINSNKQIKPFSDAQSYGLLKFFQMWCVKRLFRKVIVILSSVPRVGNMNEINYKV